MTSCCVLGNGPGLDREFIPTGSYPIGVNRSYERVRSQIICSIDAPAARDAYEHSGAMLYLVSDSALPMVMKGVAWSRRPDWASTSGAFAIWCAANLGFQKIYLLGFGGHGHMDVPDDLDRRYMAEGLLAAVEYARRSAVVVPLQEVDYCPELHLEVQIR